MPRFSHPRRAVTGPLSVPEGALALLMGRGQGSPGDSSSQTPAPKGRAAGRAAGSAGHNPPAGSPGSPRRGDGEAGRLLALSSH